MATSSKGRRPKSLSHGRPPTIRARKPSTTGAPARSIASKHTRRVIRQHHTLQKRLAQARKLNDTTLEAQIEKQLAAEGGLDLYQEASVNGANKVRGGDTSKKLVEFLGPLLKQRRGSDAKLKMLDVGALSLDTAAARCGAFDITRIDLESRAKGILKQDFMDRPLPPEGPSGEVERFDVICLSLVLNYVPDAQGRGDMLKRVRSFLRSPLSSDETGNEDIKNENLDEKSLESNFQSPFLFLVLPAPCLTNSRYLNQSRLEAIMVSLGFMLLKQAVTEKLAYQLWRWCGCSRLKKAVSFLKKEVNPGRNRNNFAITV